MGNRECDNEEVGRIFGPFGEEVTGGKCLMRSFMVCFPHRMLLKLVVLNGMRWMMCVDYVEENEKRN
jgi:hypothetical protein